MLETLEIYPSCEFWESDLEMSISKLLHNFQSTDIRTSWLNSLSSRQLNIIFQPDIQKISVSYYLIDHFNYERLESAVAEIAKLCLAEDTMNSFLVKNNRYDKKALLFTLFNIDPYLLKSVYYFDKVQKRGFVAFALKDPPRQMKILFKDFISKASVQQALQEHDVERNDGFESQLQDIFSHKNRIYLFIRRASFADLVLKSNCVVHGYKPDQIILDFSTYGNQVNLCTRNFTHSIKIANNIVSKYFQQECLFINMQSQNFVAQVRAFFEVCMNNADDNIRLFELKLKSKKFKSNTYLVLSVNPEDSIAEELQTLELSIGDILDDVTLIASAKIIFRDKKVTMFFSSNMQCGITIHYSEYVLEKKEREDFTLQMEELYGITILPKTRCCSHC